MPNPELIKSKIELLPPIEDFHWSRARGDSLWEGNEKGGHFHFFNRVGYDFSKMAPFSGSEASISGSEDSKAKLSNDFIAVLGKPTREVKKNHKIFLVWRKI